MDIVDMHARSAHICVYRCAPSTVCICTMHIVHGHHAQHHGSYRAKNWKIDFFTKTVFLTIQVEIAEVWRFPGLPHRAYGHTCKFSADLVLHGIEKSTFQHFPVNWHFKVHCTRNGPQNLPFCPGSLQDTFIMFPRYLTNIFFRKYIFHKKNDVHFRPTCWPTRIYE